MVVTKLYIVLEHLKNEVQIHSIQVFKDIPNVRVLFCP